MRGFRRLEPAAPARGDVRSFLRARRERLAGPARERVERFAGHVPLILMSYNATPEKTQQWLRDNHELPFYLFVEEIPWSETRGYVKHISVNLARYETLLGTDIDLLARAHLPPEPPVPTC